MNPSHTRNAFSMLEVVLALVVIVIGIVGIMSLLPVGLDANRQATADSNAADAAEQFLHFASAEAAADWSFLNAFPDSKPSFGDNTSSSISASNLDGSSPSDPNDPGHGGDSDLDIVWSNAVMLADSSALIHFHAINSDDSFDPNRHGTGMFRVKQITDNNIEDFDGIMRAWKETTNYDVSGSAVTITLKVEVSHPANVPYINRSKEVFSTEVFRPDLQALDQPANLIACATTRSVPAGDTVEGADVLYEGLTVSSSSGLGIAYAEGAEPPIFTAPNDGNVVAQGCTNAGYAFADSASEQNRGHDFVFVFTEATVPSFSLRMLDFGDYNPAGATEHSASLVAYDAAGQEVDRDTLTFTSTTDLLPRDGNGAPGDLYYTGDACSAAPGQPGNYTFSVAAENIARVALEFSHNGSTNYKVSDPGIAFADICFPYICDQIGGDLNINPNNSPNNEFYLVKPDGSSIWRDDLHRDAKISKDGDYYNGPATFVRVKPKGNGNQNTVTLDSETYLIENRYTYKFTGDLLVRVWNDKPNKGKAMGHWWISFAPACATIENLGENPPAEGGPQPPSEQPTPPPEEPPPPPPPAATHTITATATPGGSISPAGASTVNAGDNQSYTSSAAAGFELSDVLVDGTSIGAQANHTFTSVAADHSIHAVFTAIPVTPTYTITATAGTGGSISPAGASSVTEGANLTYYLRPSAGWVVNDVQVDGASVGAVTSYAFNNVTADHTIAVTFRYLSYTITASCNAGGAITPAGASTVGYGGSKKYTITPETCPEPEPIGFNISNGAVVASAAQSAANITVIGASLNNGFYNQKITASVSVGANTSSPWGKMPVDGNLNDGAQHSHDAGTISGGTAISLTATTWIKKRDRYSGDSNSHWKVEKSVASSAAHVLRNGDAAPVAFTAAYLSAYVTAGTVTLPDNQALMIFELGIDGDYQDLGVLVTLTSPAITCTNHEIADVLVNGTSVGAVTTYTFTNVRADQSIEVVFKEK
jgi:type II secretory pathway pseudopilin PulG